MDRVAFSILGIDIYWYAILILVGVIIGIFLATKEASRVNIGSTFINDLLFYIIPVAIIGARLYYEDKTIQQ